MKEIILDNIKYKLVPVSQESALIPFEKGDWVCSDNNEIKYTNRFGDIVPIPNEIDYVYTKNNAVYVSYTKVSSHDWHRIDAIRKASHDEILDRLIHRHCNFKEGDTVWFKDKGVRKECGTRKYLVLGFELCVIGDIIIDDYITVHLKYSCKPGSETSYLSCELTKYDESVKSATDNNQKRTIILDGIKYKWLYFINWCKCYTIAICLDEIKYLIIILLYIICTNL
jgi:hypothetical protein